MNLFHGGVPNLKPGDRIVPPDETGAPSLAHYGARGICRTDRVYVTTSWHAARMYAAFYPRALGCVYLVEPEGDLEHDPDCTEVGLSFQVPAARVLRVLPISESVRRKVLRHFSLEVRRG